MRAINPFLYPLRKRLGPWPLGGAGTAGRALLSYITLPFFTRRGLRANPRSHSNFVESERLVAVLAALGHAVDVVDYDARCRVDFARYDLLLGFGRPFEESFFARCFRGRRILYATGAHPAQLLAAEARRARNFARRNGYHPRPRRQLGVPWAYSVVNADAMLVIGNGWTVDTYAGTQENVHALPAPTLRQYAGPDVAPHTGPGDGVLRLLWFGGAGALHKGLDLLVEAAGALRRRVDLTICGRISRERDIVDHYRRACWPGLRLQWHHFIEVESPSFLALTAAHDFVVLPSCSEGSATSVYNCMAEGLVPVCTAECGIDLHDFGIPIRHDSVAGVRRALVAAAALLPAERALRSQRAARHARLHHSPAAFEAAAAAALAAILGCGATHSTAPTAALQAIRQR